MWQDQNLVFFAIAKKDSFLKKNHSYKGSLFISTKGLDRVEALVFVVLLSIKSFVLEIVNLLLYYKAL